MRVRNFILVGLAAGLVTGAAAFADENSPPVASGMTTTAPRCPAVKGDDPSSPKIIPNLFAAREELRLNHVQRAAAHLRPLAEDGNVEAQRELGQLLLREGCNMPTDKKGALSWLRKAAAKQDVPAQFLLGQALIYGKGGNVDEEDGAMWIKRAAKAGDARAQTMLGYLYFAGRGVKTDKKEGIAWTVKAAEQGIAVALSNLAKSYMNGDGLPKDLHQAMILISAAQQRIPPTQYQLISRLNETRYSIAHLLSVEEARAAEKEAEKWTPGPGSLAKVLTDSANWKAGDSKPSTEHDAGG